MRLFIAALLGGIILFTWGFVSHAVLPLGSLGMGTASDDAAVIAGLREGLPAREGIYLVPGLTPEQYEDPAAVAAYSASAVANPNAFIVYQPVGRDGMAMGPQLGLEFVTNLVAAGVLAWILSLLPAGFGRRFAVAVAAGLFAWLVTSVPYWNWYRFPLDFTLANLATTLVGWALAGAGMAAWLGRKGA